LYIDPDPQGRQSQQRIQGSSTKEYISSLDRLAPIEMAQLDNDVLLLVIIAVASFVSSFAQSFLSLFGRHFPYHKAAAWSRASCQCCVTNSQSASDLRERQSSNDASIAQSPMFLEREHRVNPTGRRTR
jgi:hypothetical protein